MWSVYLRPRRPPEAMLSCDLFFVLFIFSALSSVTWALPLEARQLSWKPASCPNFDTFATLDTIPDYAIFYVAPSPDILTDPGLRRRGGALSSAGRKSRPLALPSSEILQIALAAGHVMVVVATRGVAELVLAGYQVGVQLVSARPFGYQTDHILPVGILYLFVKSLPSGLQRSKLEILLPSDGSETDFTRNLKNGIFNAACNLMLVPDWINVVMGELVNTSGKLRSQKPFDAQAAGFIRDYMTKIQGYYFNTVYVVARALATAAADPELQQLFTAYCTQQFARVQRFVSPATGWDGPPLQLLELDPTGDITSGMGDVTLGGTCHMRCLLGNATVAPANETADGAAAAADAEAEASSAPASPTGFADLGTVPLQPLMVGNSASPATTPDPPESG